MMSKCAVLNRAIRECAKASNKEPVWTRSLGDPAKGRAQYAARPRNTFQCDEATGRAARDALVVKR
jgi:hypothetical protein